MKPIVSVGIAAHNGAAFISEAIESLLTQTAGPIQITVVDDGSNDGTADLVSRYSEVELIRQTQRGVSAARNRAAERAESDFLAFLDQDDLWEPELAATLVPKLRMNGDSALIYADSTIIDSEGVPHGTRASFLDYQSGQVFRSLIQANFIPIETMVLRRRVFEDFRGFDKNLRFLEDLDLCLRIASQHPIEFEARPLARYRIHEGNLSHQIEKLLSEYVLLLESLAASTAGDAEITEIAIHQAMRRRYELAWQGLRRGDRQAAKQALSGIGQFSLSPTALKVQLGKLLLACLPDKTATKLCSYLPHRRLYGVSKK